MISAHPQVDSNLREWKKSQTEALPVHTRIAPAKFEGGRSAVLDSSACSKCLALYPTASCFVMADDKGNIPVLKSYGIGEAKSAIAEALGEQPKKDFQNLLKSKDLQNVNSYCYACYGEKMHGDKNHFLKNRGEYSTLSS